MKNRISKNKETNGFMIIAFIMTVFSFSSFSSSQPSSQPSKKVVCKTPRSAKVITIGDDKVAIEQPLKIGAPRGIASMAIPRTKLTETGFTKILFHKGEKHIIHIENKNKLSELNDYLIVRSTEGHEITFPLSCN